METRNTSYAKDAVDVNAEANELKARMGLSTPAAVETQTTEAEHKTTGADADIREMIADILDQLKGLRVRVDMLLDLSRIPDEPSSVGEPQ
jgi:hypothetical protein